MYFLRLPDRFLIVHSLSDLCSLLFALDTSWSQRRRVHTNYDGQNSSDSTIMTSEKPIEIDDNYCSIQNESNYQDGFQETLKIIESFNILEAENCQNSKNDGAPEDHQYMISTLQSRKSSVTSSREDCSVTIRQTTLLQQGIF